jgi:hypothetical protein
VQHANNHLTALIDHELALSPAERQAGPAGQHTFRRAHPDAAIQYY